MKHNFHSTIDLNWTKDELFTNKIIIISVKNQLKGEKKQELIWKKRD